MRINIDVDGVLRDMATTTVRTYMEFYDSNFRLPYEKIKNHNFRKVMPKVKDFGEFYKTYAEQVFYNAKRYDGSREFIDSLIDDGHIVQIVTNQLPGTEKHTLEWLADNSFSYHSIHFTPDKYVVEGHALVDDYDKNLNESSAKFPICFGQPWNKNYKGLRVEGYDECYDILDKIKRLK